MYSTVKNAERTFGFTITVNNDIDKTGEELGLLSLLYDVYSEVAFHNAECVPTVYIFSSQPRRLIRPMLP